MLSALRTSLLARISVPALLASAALAQSWVPRTATPSPAARNSSSNWLAYDPVRGVSTLFGGYLGNSTALNDTWEWNGTAWTQRTPATAPTGRWGHGMVQDTRRGRAVMFGGLVPSTGQFTNETWEWDGSNWQLVVPAQSPSARGYFGMAYDSVRGNVVVFGGDSGVAKLGDTWLFDGAGWRQAPAGTAPSARQGAAMAFDAIRGESVLFGGQDFSVTLSDTWTFNGVSWQQRAPVASPTSRHFASMCADNLAGTVLMFGGSDFANATHFGETWAWDGANWTSVTASGPSARGGAAMAFDMQRGQTTLFGGGASGGNSNDTWELASAGVRTMSTLTPPRVGSQAVFRYDYPRLSGAGNLYIHLLTAHFAGSQSLNIPGFTSLGLARCDLTNIFVQTSGFLGASGQEPWTVQIPADNYFAGLQFDVQTADLSLLTNTIFWASNDVEVAITPMVAPVASFQATGTAGVAPLVVQFTDTSINNPTSWQWDFDNNGVVDSTLRNPTFTYTSNGLYSVRLVAGNAAGSNAVTRQRLVYVGVVPPASLNMVAIQPGTFQMGSTAVGGTAAPVHAVTITQPFWIGKYEVTSAEYRAYDPSYPVLTPQAAASYVSWTSAVAFCAALNATEAAAGRIPAGYQYRLPTEAEWEYCCRAGTVTEWNTGASINGLMANFGFDPLGGAPRIVGSYLANPWGLRDTHGNVSEWCMDAWDAVSSNYPVGTAVDPYVVSGSFRVRRGGSWVESADACRSAARRSGAPGESQPYIGFRLCLAPVLYGGSVNPALNMVPIAAGTFQMGSTVVGGHAAPVHAVTITRPFWVGKYEVTQAQYQAVRGTNPSFYQGASYPNAQQRPVESVSWNDAMAYCSALTANEAAAGRIPAGYQYRLPTEAEWEYVCRAGTTTEWNTGASLVCGQAKIIGCGLAQTTPVGSYPANPWGLFDTHGNVYEWCLDSWDGFANYPSSAVSDPYVSSGPYRVLRGGSWNVNSSYCRSADRSLDYPDFTFNFVGFRVCLAPFLVP